MCRENTFKRIYETLEPMTLDQLKSLSQKPVSIFDCRTNEDFEFKKLLVKIAGIELEWNKIAKCIK